MPAPVQSPQRLRFRQFELDLTCGELRKDGQKIALPPKAFEILRALVERPGEVVSREELRSRLWAGDTYVEFEDSLNHAVNKLRQALGDSVENPLFIETVPRYGYRFIGHKVEQCPDGQSRQESAIESAHLAQSLSRDHAHHVTHHRLWLGVVFAALILLGLSTNVFVHKQPAQALTERDIVVMADFANKTNDPVFTDTLRQGLLVQLSQSPFFNFLAGSQIRQTLQHMGHKANEPLDDDLGRQVCQRNHGKAFLAGSIASVGDQYVLNLKAVNCSTGDVLAQQQTQVARKEDVIRALGEQATLLRGKLGESLGSIQKFDVPLEQATTPSLEALQAYSVGWRYLSQSDSQAAIIPYQRAIELDPDFAMAYQALGSVYGNMDETGLMEENMGKAYSLRSRTTEAESLRIEAGYNMYVIGDRYKGMEIYRLVKSVYPQAAYPYNHIGTAYIGLGQYDKALAEYQEFYRRNPTGMGLGNLVGVLVNLSRQEEAEKLLAEGETRHLNRQSMLPFYYGLAFLRHDTQQMGKIVTEASADPGMQRQLFSMQADTAAYEGRFKQSRKFRQQAVEHCLNYSLVESAAAQLAAAAMQESDVGNFKQARLLAARSLTVARTRVVLAAAALAYAQAGNVHQAQQLVDELGRRYPSHTFATLLWIPNIQGIVAMQQGDSSRAVEILQTTSPVELGNGNSEMDNGLELHPVHTRGQAYLAAHRGVDAAVEFRKILDHPELVGGSAVAGNTVVALAHVGLARAYVLQGESAKARSEYEQFLNLWKDADSDIPIYKQAKAEYAKIQ
jgi:eukaryotic-like serine/threonine-protein kinase